jgi:hypothetical protein
MTGRARECQLRGSPSVRDRRLVCNIPARVARSGKASPWRMLPGERKRQCARCRRPASHIRGRALLPLRMRRVWLRCVSVSPRPGLRRAANRAARAPPSSPDVSYLSRESAPSRSHAPAAVPKTPYQGIEGLDRARRSLRIGKKDKSSKLPNARVTSTSWRGNVGIRWGSSRALWQAPKSLLKFRVVLRHCS